MIDDDDDDFIYDRLLTSKLKLFDGKRGFDGVAYVFLSHLVVKYNE